MKHLVQFARLKMRDLLPWIANGNRWFHRLIEWILKFVYPYGFAAIAYRRGNLSGVSLLGRKNPDSLLATRAIQMLEVLRRGHALENLPEPKQRSFNRSVLFAVHSNAAYDANGYAVRTQHVLDAISDRGMNIVTTTRPGYPWDLQRHATKQATATSTVGDYEYRHLHDDIGLRRPELDYINDYANTLFEVARSANVGVIHAHSNYLNGLAAVAAGRRFGCGVVYEMRGLWHVTRSSTDSDYKISEHFAYCDLMEAEAARLADRVVAISAALKSWLVEKGVNPSKITVVGNTAETIPGIFERRSRRERREHDPFHLGYVGTLTRYEGLDVLLKAVRLLVDMQANIKLTIAGDGAYANTLKQLSKQLGLKNQIEFLGRVPQDQTPELYESFDACPLPRRAHDVTKLIPPLKPFEIMVHGVPIIVTNLPPLAEIVAHETRGLVCEPDCPESLANAIVKIRDDSSQAQKMARTAERWVAAEASRSHMSQSYAKVYQDICTPEP